MKPVTDSQDYRNQDLCHRKETLSLQSERVQPASEGGGMR